MDGEEIEDYDMERQLVWAPIPMERCVGCNAPGKKCGAAMISTCAAQGSMCRIDAMGRARCTF